MQIDDVVSPSIIARLQSAGGHLPRPDPRLACRGGLRADRRGHDGKVFNVTLADVPERKQDLVAGRYELPAPPAGAMVAVKMVDMLGEELLIEHGL